LVKEAVGSSVTLGCGLRSDVPGSIFAAARPENVMPQSNHIIVARVRNETASEMRLHLEMLGAEIVMSPGHAIDLLAASAAGLLPITIDCVNGGLQIHPHKEFDPDWHVLFAGKVIPAGYPTVLADHE
jgi:hypothetical protein